MDEFHWTNSSLPAGTVSGKLLINLCNLIIHASALQQQVNWYRRIKSIYDQLKGPSFLIDRAFNKYFNFRVVLLVEEQIAYSSFCRNIFQQPF